jgi:hypothetical protein
MKASLNKLNLDTTLHRDGRVTHYSTLKQMWVTERSLSENELASKPENERKKIKRHLNKHNFWI